MVQCRQPVVAHQHAVERAAERRLGLPRAGEAGDVMAAELKALLHRVAQRRLVVDEKDAAFRHAHLSIGGQGITRGSQAIVVAATKAVVPALVYRPHWPIRSLVRRCRWCVTFGWAGFKKRTESPHTL